MAELKPLIINAPRQGIGPSPHVGFGDCRNLDIFSIPGVALLNNPLVKKSASTVTGLPQWIVKNPATPTEFYGLDSDGVVYKSTDSGATWSVLAGNTAGGKGQGLQIWKGYLFVAYTAGLDVYGPLAGGAAWSLAWKTIDSDTLWHPMIISKNDNKLYGGAGKFIFSLDENSGQTFAPGNAATYTWTQQALDLPPNYRIKCLEELGVNLMAGTWMGTNIYDVKVADIFPWDRSSVSFNQPISMAENGVNAMLNDGTYLIVLAGITGAIYKSDGVTAVPIGQIPETVANLSGGLYLEPYPGAIIKYKGRPFFGVSGGGTSAIAGMGVYSLMQTSKGSIVAHEHTISTGNDGASNVLKIGALCEVSKDVLLAGWRDNAAYGIDKTNNSARQTGHTAFFDSPFFGVGTPLNKRPFTQLEFQLAKPLLTNEGIRIEYRTDLAATFTTIGTYVFSGTGTIIGGVSSHNTEAAIPDCENLQIRVSPTGTTTTPHFKSLTLR